MLRASRAKIPPREKFNRDISTSDITKNGNNDGMMIFTHIPAALTVAADISRNFTHSAAQIPKQIITVTKSLILLIMLHHHPKTMFIHILCEIIIK